MILNVIVSHQQIDAEIVILSEAKDLVVDYDRPFASLMVKLCDRLCSVTLECGLKNLHPRPIMQFHEIIRIIVKLHYRHLQVVELFY